jgi:hypothetical protein
MDMRKRESLESEEVDWEKEKRAGWEGIAGVERRGVKIWESRREERS